MTFFLGLSESIQPYLIVSIFLLFFGIIGLITRRSLIGMLISIELILNGAALNFMTFSRFVSSDPVVGQIFTLFIMGIAAAEAAIALSIMVAVYRHFRSVDTDDIRELKG